MDIKESEERENRKWIKAIKPQRSPQRHSSSSKGACISFRFHSLPTPTKDQVFKHRSLIFLIQIKARSFFIFTVSSKAVSKKEPGGRKPHSRIWATYKFKAMIRRYGGFEDIWVRWSTAQSKHALLRHPHKATETSRTWHASANSSFKCAEGRKGLKKKYCSGFCVEETIIKLVPKKSTKLIKELYSPGLMDVAPEVRPPLHLSPQKAGWEDCSTPDRTH